MSKLKFAAVSTAAIGVAVAAKAKGGDLIDAAIDKMVSANDKVEFLADLTRAEHKVRDNNPKVYEDLSGIITQVSKATNLDGMEICQAILQADELKKLTHDA